jgi:hypothetical protein
MQSLVVNLVYEFLIEAILKQVHQQAQPFHSVTLRCCDASVVMFDDSPIDAVADTLRNASSVGSASVNEGVSPARDTSVIALKTLAQLRAAPVHCSFVPGNGSEFFQLLSNVRRDERVADRSPGYRDKYVHA